MSTGPLGYETLSLAAARSMNWLLLVPGFRYSPNQVRKISQRAEVGGGQDDDGRDQGYLRSPFQCSEPTNPMRAPGPAEQPVFPRCTIELTGLGTTLEQNSRFAALARSQRDQVHLERILLAGDAIYVNAPLLMSYALDESVRAASYMTGALVLNEQLYCLILRGAPGSTRKNRKRMCGSGHRAGHYHIWHSSGLGGAESHEPAPVQGSQGHQPR